MAELSQRLHKNTPGKYYTDSECIDCSLCSEIAPEHFTICLDSGHDYVYRQPLNKQEEVQCIEAMESCPVDAIGDNGHP